MCAGVTVGHQGPCEGDSGGPLMSKDLESGKFVQIATVSSGVGECGDDEFPGIYVRLDHPSILNFITSVINNEQKHKGNIKIGKKLNEHNSNKAGTDDVN